jgi:hypothetical protein
MYREVHSFACGLIITSLQSEKAWLLCEKKITVTTQSHNPNGLSIHTQKLLAAKPDNLPHTLTAAESGVFQHRHIFHNDIINSVTIKFISCDFSK